MIASGLATFLGHGQPPEFTRPYDQCFVQKAALFQIGQQTGDRLVRFLGEASVVSLDVVVPVPTSLIRHAARINLDETCAALD